MNKDNLNISKIETYLNSILDGVVSNNVFFTTYPNVAVVQSSDWQDMILIDIPSGISDMEAMGKGHIFVGLYARPHESGKKNVAMMSDLEQKLNDVLANATDPRYSLLREDTYATYDEDINWHCNVVTLTLLVA